LLLVLFVLSLISPLLCLAGILILLGLYMRRIDRSSYMYSWSSPCLSFLLQGSSAVSAVSSSGTLKAIVDVNESKGNAYALAALKSTDERLRCFLWTGVERAGSMMRP